MPILDVERWPKPAYLSYIVSVALVFLMLLLRVATIPIVGDESPYMPFFIAVVLSAWYGGRGPGFFTTALSCLAAIESVIRPETLFSTPELTSLAIFASQGLLVSYLMDAAIRSKRRLTNVMTSISDGFIVFDREWRYAYVNQRAAEMARLKREEMLGKRIWDLFPDLVDTEFDRKLHEVASRRYPIHFEFLYPRWGTWYLYGAYPSPEGLVLFEQDVTELKEARMLVDEAREQIERVNLELEQRVEERTAQLNSTIRELEAFSYSVSHDLRAPLRAIDGFSKMLHEDYHDKLDDEAKRLIEIIRHNTTNMGRLIDGLLAFSRLGRQPMGHAHLVMSELVKDAIEEIRGSTNGRNIEFRVGDLPDADGDRVLLRQVLINLVSNAVKFTRERNPAIIEIACKQEADRNVFYVRDNGAGFESRYVDKMFGVFQRLHAATEYEGTGLGLAIVQRIVHRHGGRVWAEGSVGAGATIYFSLPKPEAEADTPKPAPAA